MVGGVESTRPHKGHDQTVVAQNADDRGALDKLIQDSSLDCNILYKNRRQRADQITVAQFDKCYYGQTLPDGTSRTLLTPIMHPGKTDKEAPKPVLEPITTQGITRDSRRLDVYVHSLPALAPIQWGDQTKGSAATAPIVTEDGLMLTNKHVVDGLSPNGTIQVTLTKPDGSKEIRSARLVDTDAGQDLALLQINARPAEKFPWLPLSQVTQYGIQEPLVEMGNANGQGNISMARASYGKPIQQDDIVFKEGEKPKDVFPGRTLLDLKAEGVPHGYSGGVVMSVPGSDVDADGHVTRLGPTAIRAITDYSDLTHRSKAIPAAYAQAFLNRYLKKQADQKKQQ